METIVTETKEGIGFIRFNRPEVRNAVNLQMMDELLSQLKLWQSDDAIKVLILTGVGPYAFVSGGDVEQLHQFKTKESIHPVLMKMSDVLQFLKDWGKPTIAMINGYAIGGGCEIATACDFRFANEEAQMGFVQINIGITTGWGGGTRLIQLLGRSKALELLLTGKRIDAKRAYELGFVDKIFTSTELERKTLEFAAEIASKNPSVVSQYLRMANDAAQDVSIGMMIKSEVEYCSELWEKEEHVEAVEKFLRETRNR